MDVSWGPSGAYPKLDASDTKGKKIRKGNTYKMGTNASKLATERLPDSGAELMVCLATVQFIFLPCCFNSLRSIKI